jgi:hypothetical protein
VQETESAFQNAFFTSVALTISAPIHGRTPGTLSLVDGLLVTFLPIIITIGAVNDTHILSRGSAMLKFAYIIHLAFCVGYGIMVWVRVDDYATTPDCNLNSSVMFVVFGCTITATSRGLRAAGIVLFGFIGVLLLWVARSFIVSPAQDREGRASWWWKVIPIISWVYELVTIEDIIRRNMLGNVNNQWSYGQTFSLVMLIGPVCALASAIWKRNRTTKWEPVSGMSMLFACIICCTNNLMG